MVSNHSTVRPMVNNHHKPFKPMDHWQWLPDPKTINHVFGNGNGNGNGNVFGNWRQIFGIWRSYYCNCFSVFDIENTVIFFVCQFSFWPKLGVFVLYFVGVYLVFEKVCLIFVYVYF